MAVFGPDGRFEVTTIHPGDGLMPGEYQVSVECWEVAPSMNPADKPRSFAPDKFQSGATSGLNVVVPADARGPIDVRFDVPRRAD